jgi:hypothetical protein
MRDEIFNMLYPLSRECQEQLAKAVQASEEQFAAILSQGAKQFDCRQTHNGNIVTWLNDSGTIEAMFFRIVDPRKANEIQDVYTELVEKKCPLGYVFLRQLPDGEEAWDIFRLSERSYMEHCNRISGPHSWCGEDDEDEDDGKHKKLKVENIDISGSELRNVKMSKTVFEDIDFSGAKFFNINLRDAEIGAVDFGGASFSCMNTGEDHPRKPVVFNSIELDDCTIQNCYFRNTKLVKCDLTGMTIDGVLVTDMIKVYKTATKP